jgi:hypothetical protein
MVSLLVNPVDFNVILNGVVEVEENVVGLIAIEQDGCI